MKRMSFRRGKGFGNYQREMAGISGHVEKS